MKDSNVVEMETDSVTAQEKIVTHKKYLKRTENIVRRLDNVLTDLSAIVNDAAAMQDDIHSPSAESISDKDYARITEIVSVSSSVNTILFQLVNRMSRKYVGQKIQPVDLEKRKSLKLK